MEPLQIISAIGAASAVGHLAKDTIMSADETPHELGSDHEGFRKVHESLAVGLGILGLTGIGTIAAMYWLHQKNEQEHNLLQEQLDALFNLAERNEGRRVRPTSPDETVNGITFPAWLKKAGVKETGYVPGLKSSAEWRAWNNGEDPKRFASTSSTNFSVLER